MLAPTKYKRFASYVTGKRPSAAAPDCYSLEDHALLQMCKELTLCLGWLTSIAWVAVLATGSIFVGTILQGLIILDNDSYSPHQWHGTLLCWSVLAVAVFVNTVVSGLLPMIEGIILVLHVLGFIAVLITLTYLAPHGSAASVFSQTLNGGSWPTQGISYCVGFIGNVATFVGTTHLWDCWF